MSSITLSQIQQDPLGFVRRVEAGESMLIVEGSRPLAEIKPVAGLSAGQRPYGKAAGEFIVPANFDAPLPEGILREFEEA
jgi:antitoxin (DNA-binding transcriptional repressor) of toxin-antitoxin stability system